MHLSENRGVLLDSCEMSPLVNYFAPTLGYLLIRCFKFGAQLAELRVTERSASRLAPLGGQVL